MCGPQIWLCLFMFRPIASKQLNSLTTINTFSWLGGAVVTHPLWVQEVPGSIPGSSKGFYVWFLVLLLLCFYFLSKNTLFVTKFCNSFYNVNLLSILNILQDLWPIIRVWRYRPSIFNKHGYLDALHANKSKCFTVYCFLHCQIYFIDNFMKFLLNYHSYVDLQIIIKLILKFHFFVFNKWIFQYINFYI